ncbi:MAG: hypothetical protein HY744_16280 [Deltaproteobacteria bacterium]|nr:hypothetical protein [Deltaproteobacteria bacterium]
MRARWIPAVGVVWAIALAACDEPAPSSPPLEAVAVAPPCTSAEAIPDAPVAGTLRGVPFAARDMRYEIVRRPGGKGGGPERVDIKLSAAPASAPCGPRAADAPSVWIRLEGVRLAPQELRRRADGEQASWSVHYQAREQGRWVGNGSGAALLVLRAVRPDYLVEGDLAVCFADGMGSCVSGSFSARYCPDPAEPVLRKLGPEVKKQPP